MRIATFPILTPWYRLIAFTVFYLAALLIP